LTLTLPFQDGVVLQRGEPIVVRGAGIPGDRVWARFDGELAEGRCADDGQFELEFGPRGASFEPQQLSVEDAHGRRLDLADVLVGDVWLIAGAASLGRPEPAAGRARQDLQDLQGLPDSVRFLALRAAASPEDRVWDAAERAAVQSSFLRGTWQKASAAADASRVVYAFAHSLHAAESIPLGLVQLAGVPAPLTSWCARPALWLEPACVGALQDWWGTPTVDGQLHARARRNLAGLFDTAVSVHGAGVHPYQPGFLWQHGVAPLRGFPAAGVVFGCTAEAPEDPEVHERLLRRLIDTWRLCAADSAQPLPFVLVESSVGELLGAHAPPGLTDRRAVERRIASGPEALAAVTFVEVSDLESFGRAPDGAARLPRGTRAEELGGRLAAAALAGRAGEVARGWGGADPLAASTTALGAR